MKKLIIIAVMVLSSSLCGFADATPPEPVLTRSEFIQLLSSALQIEMKDQKDMPFQDISSTDPGYMDLQKAYSLGYISGSPGGLFRPNDSLTREEMAAILSRVYCQTSGIDKTQLVFTAELLYRDQGGVSDWARTDMKLCNSLGLLEKDKENYIRPQAKVLKSEAVHSITTLQELLTKN